MTIRMIPQTRPRLSALEVIGKALLSMSVGVLLFLAWNLWGTNVIAEREQVALAATFDSQPAFFKVDPGEEAPALLPPEDLAPRVGKPVFRLRIPAIRVNEVAVEGVATEQLDVGPGHYPTCRKGVDPALCTPWDSPFPGEQGRVVISGHRTTHGAVFWDLDKLRAGQKIITETKWGTFTYLIEKTRIVDESSRKIVIPGNRAELVLTTCHPKFSAAQRLIVISRLSSSAPPS
jgi:sortase A